MVTFPQRQHTNTFLQCSFIFHYRVTQVHWQLMFSITYSYSKRIYLHVNEECVGEEHDFDTVGVMVLICSSVD